MPLALSGWARAAILLIAICGWFNFGWAQDLQPVPPLAARVTDLTGTLDAIQLKGIGDKLAALEQAKGSQVAFLMVATTLPEDIASYANRVANEWKIGRKGVGDGVLLIVAKDDRKVRIEVAKTLEGAIPDLAARQIIDEAITPNFRAGNYAAGLLAAADQIGARVRGEALPEPARRGPSGQGGGGGFNWFDLAIFLFLAVPIAGAVLRGIFGRKLGALLTGGGVGTIALLLTSSLVVGGIAALVALLFSMFSGGMGAGLLGSGRRGSGWAAGPVIGGMGGWGAGGGGGGWGGGGGGGGFGSGGGGDFGGGGASGDW